MAKAIGKRRRSGAGQSNAVLSDAVAELLVRLEALAQVNGETRSAVFTALESGDEPDYAAAYGALFSAVAMLGPRRAARILEDAFANAAAD